MDLILEVCLKANIYDILKRCNVNIQNCVGQTYDGASVMSGTHAGVQTLIKNDVPQATYIHCYNHRLNLVIVDTVKTVKMADQFFGLLEAIYVFMSSNVPHEIFLRKQAELRPGKQPMKLKMLSETRWACQHAACKVMLQTITAVIATIEEISEEHSGKCVTAAAGLLKTVDFCFLVNLAMFFDLLQRTKLLSDMLQSPSLNFGAAADMIESVREELVDDRSEEAWNGILVVAENLATTLEISLELPKSKRTKHISKRLEGFVVTETVGQRDELATERNLCMFLYYPVIDKLLSELDSRFNESNRQLLRSISALGPCSFKFLDIELIKPMVLHYDIDMSDFDVELRQAKRLVSRKQSEGIVVDTYS